MNTNSHGVGIRPGSAAMGGARISLRPESAPQSYCRAILSLDPSTAERRVMPHISRAAHQFQIVAALTHHPAVARGTGEVVRVRASTFSNDVFAPFHSAVLPARKR